MIAKHIPVVAQGLSFNHAESAVKLPVVAQGLSFNHAEGVVAR